MSEEIAALAKEIASLRAELAEVKAAARTAQDYHAICNLQAAYGYYVDKGKWDEAAELFAEDGTIELAGRGVPAPPRFPRPGWLCLVLPCVLADRER